MQPPGISNKAFMFVFTMCLYFGDLRDRRESGLQDPWGMPSSASRAPDAIHQSCMLVCVAELLMQHVTLHGTMQTVPSATCVQKHHSIVQVYDACCCTNRQSSGKRVLCQLECLLFYDWFCL